MEKKYPNPFKMLHSSMRNSLKYDKDSANTFGWQGWETVSDFKYSWWTPLDGRNSKTKEGIFHNVYHEH